MKTSNHRVTSFGCRWVIMILQAWAACRCFQNQFLNQIWSLETTVAAEVDEKQLPQTRTLLGTGGDLFRVNCSSPGSGVCHTGLKKGKKQGRLQLAGLWRLPHTVRPGGRKQEIDRRSVVREEARDHPFQQIWERNLRLRGQSHRRRGGAATAECNRRMEGVGDTISLSGACHWRSIRSLLQPSQQYSAASPL
ncbi:hypothetical protein BHE74_00015302 [Ensete ventricosum]|nr:hypothetical protein BHE74_00015302 [Ensete ventricosum]